MHKLQSCAAIAVAAVTMVGCATSRRSVEPDRPSGWPVDPRLVTITSSYGSSRRGDVHEGIDLAAPSGTPVIATAAGIVIEAERSGRYGRRVVIDHGGGWQTSYAHLRRIRVEPGDRVRRGDTVGTVGRSGNATGFHLHYEVRRDGRPLDPASTLNG